MANTKVNYFQFSESNFLESEIGKIEDISNLIDLSKITWINISGISNIETIESVGKILKLHPLIIEDITNTEHLPKIEFLDNNIFILIKKIGYDIKLNEISSEQVSIIFNKHIVVSISENSNDFFQPIIERLRYNPQRFYKLGSDYLCYCLLDLIVDNYFLILDEISEDIEVLEENVANNPTKYIQREIHEIKRAIINFRKLIWPVRELIRHLEYEITPLIHNSNRIYFKDLYDHTIHIVETLETMRDLVATALDIYLSSINNKMNEIMKVLTVISTIFIPLTFVAGVYGMNFEHMPEIHSVWGYPLVLCLMLFMALGMVLFFKKKKWF